jgi:2-keto-4-pentenoate hydratase
MSLQPETQAAELIWQHWQAGTTLSDIPTSIRPLSRAQGYAAQAKLPQVSGRQVLGWKIAATSAAGQQHINVDGPLAGRILSGQTFAPDAVIPAFGNRMRVAEPEMAFVMGRDLPAREAEYGMEEVLAAVRSLNPALEMPDSRFATFTAAGAAQLLADNACAHQFILGQAAPEGWRDIDLGKHPVHGHVKHRDGTFFNREGSGAAVLGDPRKALVWLVNELSSMGITLQAGQFVTTGTCMQPLELAEGDVVVADYGVLGQIGMRFDR